MRLTIYHDCGVAGSKREDVGAGDGSRAGSLESGLDLVDDLEAPGGVLVGVGPLLAHDGPAAVQQQRRVAALQVYLTTKYTAYLCAASSTTTSPAGGEETMHVP